MNTTFSPNNSEKLTVETKDILDRISDAFVALDKNWRYTYMNKRAGEIFNRDPQKMIGKTEQEVIDKHFDEFNLVFERDKELVAQVGIQLMSGSVNHNNSVNRNNTKSGNTIYCEWYNSVLKDENGETLSVMSLVHD